MHKTFAATTALTLILATTAAIRAQEASDAVAPEAGASGFISVTSEAIRDAQDAKAAGKPVEAKKWMVAAANPLAVEAGAKTLLFDELRRTDGPNLRVQ